MGKGSGACDRRALEFSKENKLFTEGEPAPLWVQNLGDMDFTPKLNKLFGIKQWTSDDGQVSFHKKPSGWIIFHRAPSLQTAMEQAGLSIHNAPIFPTLKEARSAVAEVALDSNLSLSPKLTRQAYTASYRIGDLPLNVYRDGKSYWKLGKGMHNRPLPGEIALFFPGGGEEFWQALAEANLAFKVYHTRSKAVLEVKEWLQGLQAKHNNLQ
jgi:hypothetical protein